MDVVELLQDLLEARDDVVGLDVEPPKTVERLDCASYERRADINEAFLSLACCMICFNGA